MWVDTRVAGYHNVEHDLEEMMAWGREPEDVDAASYTRWLWAAVSYALMWDVPKH